MPAGFFGELVDQRLGLRSTVRVMACHREADREEGRRNALQERSVLFDEAHDGARIAPGMNWCTDDGELKASKVEARGGMVRVEQLALVPSTGQRLGDVPGDLGSLSFFRAKNDQDVGHERIALQARCHDLPKPKLSRTLTNSAWNGRTSSDIHAAFARADEPSA